MGIWDTFLITATIVPHSLHPRATSWVFEGGGYVLDYIGGVAVAKFYRLYFELISSNILGTGLYGKQFLINSSWMLGASEFQSKKLVDSFSFVMTSLFPFIPVG